ncbi:MAG TPA: hypothetical protein EYP19_00820 [Desulfobacterales bacterium]|nr:hypothetical protein [Desulfobacterales bacterium]
MTLDAAWNQCQAIIDDLWSGAISVLRPKERSIISEVPVGLLPINAVIVETWYHPQGLRCVVVSEGVWHFLSTMSRLLLEWQTGLPTELPVQTPKPDMSLAERITACALAFAVPDWCTTGYIPGGPDEVGHKILAAQMFRIQLLFLLCHEISHLLCAHDKADQEYERRYGGRAPCDVYWLAGKQHQELQADFAGSVLCMSVVRSWNDELLASLCLGAILAFFHELEFVERISYWRELVEARGKLELYLIEDHPPALARRNSLLRTLGFVLNDFGKAIDYFSKLCLDEVVNKIDCGDLKLENVLQYLCDPS